MQSFPSMHWCLFLTANDSHRQKAIYPMKLGIYGDSARPSPLLPPSSRPGRHPSVLALYHPPSPSAEIRTSNACRAYANIPAQLPCPSLSSSMQFSSDLLFNGITRQKRRKGISRQLQREDWKARGVYDGTLTPCIFPFHLATWNRWLCRFAR